MCHHYEKKEKIQSTGLLLKYYNTQYNIHNNNNDKKVRYFTLCYGHSFWKQFIHVKT